MSLSEKIPGMKPGSTVRNIILGGFYLVLLMGVLGAVGDDGSSGEGEAEADTTNEEQEQSAEAEASDDSSDEADGESVAEADGGSDSDSTEPDSGDGDGDASESESESDTQQDVTIIDHELQESALGWGVVVIVENTSGEFQDYIEVEARFYDEDGVRIDEWFNNATDVEPGERVEMTIATSEDEKPADYELEASTSPF